jgi:hypothetical protein
MSNRDPWAAYEQNHRRIVLCAHRTQRPGECEHQWGQVQPVNTRPHPTVSIHNQPLRTHAAWFAEEYITDGHGMAREVREALGAPLRRFKSAHVSRR